MTNDRALRYSLRRSASERTPDPGDAGVALRYLVMLVPTLAASIAFAMVAISLRNAFLPRTPTFASGIILNTVPPAVAGAVIYFALATRYAQRAVLRKSRHLVRAVPLYLASCALMYVVVTNWREPGFGLAAQLFVWPAFAFMSAIPAEAVAWWWRSADARTTSRSPEREETA
jgi:hypothetical protein